MLRRFRSVIVQILITSLISMSLAQVVAASHVDPLEGSAGPVMDTAHPHHDHLMVDVKSKKDCLGFCTEDLGDGFLTAASLELPSPQFIATYPVNSGQFGLVLANTLASCANHARGPPVACASDSASGLMRLLLRNARIRN